MKLLTASLAAALAASFALPAAAASPAFDAFRKACGDSGADFAAIKAALGGPGWKPTEIQPTNMEGVTPDEGVARSLESGGQKVSIYAWRGMKGQYHLTACTARVGGLNLATVDADAKAWLGFAPETGAADKATWRYGGANGAWAAVQKAGFETAAAGGGLFFLNVFADRGEVVIDLLKIKS